MGGVLIWSSFSLRRGVFASLRPRRPDAAFMITRESPRLGAVDAAARKSNETGLTKPLLIIQPQEQHERVPRAARDGAALVPDPRVQKDAVARRHRVLVEDRRPAVPDF